jgi:hypothetical protein
MIRERCGSADDGEIAEPFRSVSPREIIEGGEGSDGDGVREPRWPVPTQPGTPESPDLAPE